MFNKEKLQRFSIRKLTVGTASVLIGVSILTSWNTNKVYADSRNVTSGESIAKNNNPQEGNPAVEDNAQIVDNGSTEVSESSDSNRSNVIKSDATNRDNVRDKNDNSGTEVPELTAQVNNKQALTTVTEDNGAKVSKIEKYSNSDIKSQFKNFKKTQETTLAMKVLDKEKLSSIKLSEKLDGKIEIPATDPSNYYLSYLNGLIGDNKYIYQVLSLDGDSGSKLILSVNRNDHDDKNIYAYVTDGNYNKVKQSKTIGMDQHSIITINGREYQLNNNGSSEVSIGGNKVSTQNSSTVTSQPLDSDYYYYPYYYPIGQDYGLGNTSNDKCSNIGEIVPVFTKNSVIKYYYSDNEGNLTEIESSPNVSVEGFTGQEFEIKDVDQYKKVIQGYYLTHLPTGNFNGTLSQFSDDKYYKKVYYDFGNNKVKYSVLYHQISPNGTMEVCLFDDKGYPLTESRVIAPNTSTEFSNYYNLTDNVTVRNPYVTAAPHEVQFIYKKLGSIIPVDENGTQIGDAIQFENDTTDPTKASGIVPSISGYTPLCKLVGDQKVPTKVGDQVVNPKDPGENIEVIYSANAQKASVTYIDDKTGKALKVDELNGVTKAKSGYTTKSAIDTYTSLGYTLVSDDTNGAEVVFDNDDKVGQAFTVHLGHGTITVTPEKPGKPGEPINPGEGSVDWPDDTDVKGLTDTVNRTITYVMSDGSTAPDAVDDSLSYTASKVIDKVTGEVMETKWSANQDFKDVDSPSVKGYTPDKTVVSNKNIAHDSDDITEVVTYNADKQKASVTYIDDKTGKALKVDELNGVTKAKSGYTTKSAIDTYTSLGYTLVSDDTNGAEVVFDNDDKVGQAFTVHLGHGTITVTPEKPGKPGEPINPGEGSVDWPDDTDVKGLTDTVNRTITYVMSDGSTAPDAVDDSLSYTASKVIDKVTGEVMETKWSANQDFKDVDSPSVKGYTPDKTVVSNKNIAHDSDDITEVVTYNADKQKASVTYIDDKTGKALKVDELNGVTKAKSGYTTKSAIDTYTSLGYTLVSDDTNGAEVVFDNDDKVGQAFTVHLGHGTITVTPEKPGKPGEPINPGEGSVDWPDDTDVKGLTDTVNRTITYVMSDGSTAPDAVDDSLSYTASKVIDKVTGEVMETKWSANQDFKDVDSPSVKGYTPDKTVVSNKNIAHDSDDITEVVTYNADKQKASVTYIDDKTGKALKVDELNGVTKAKSGYTTKSAIDTYTSLGYTLVSDDTNGAEVVFDNDDKVGQAFTVHLGHGTITVTPEKPGKPGEPINPGEGSVDWPDDTDVKGLTDTVNRTITYVMSDGSTAPDAVDDSLSYTASKVIDKVTGEVMETKWSANQDFKDVDSPSVKGYTPDKTVVSNKNIAHDSDDITEVVTYNADKQKASVTYIDDKTGKALKVDELNGVTKAKSGYTTKSAIDTYTSLGYTLVSDDTNGAEVVFDNDDKVGQAFTVHLGHGTITVTPEKPGKPGEPINPGEGSVDWPDDTDVKGLTDTVNRTITYVMSDGSTAPDAVDDSLSYTASKVIDKVTGEVMETKWSANQDFKDVDSPSVKGYTPDKTVVSNKNIAHDSDDITEVVTYNADKQKASVTYIDDKTGKALKVDELNGVTKAKSGYTTKSAIDTYTSLGYTLVSDDTNGAEVVFDNDDKVGQAFTVHLGHGTITVTPEKPGKPGEPINPGEGSVDWPDDTDVKGLTDTVNRTITYVMSDGSTAPDAVDDSLSYTASKVIDKVTGEVMETKWSANQDFKDVDSPSVKGYTPDKTVVSNKNIAHDSDDITEVVTYNADKQKASVTYIDDKTGKALKVDELNGVTKAKSGYTTKSAIDTYTSLGYTLVSDDTNGAEVVFDNDDKVGQAFTVHLGHGTITVTPEKPGKPGEPINPGEGSVDWPDDTDVKGLTDTVNRTITYVMSDGSTAPDAVDDSLSYTASKVIDKVTGEVMETKWSANQDFKDVDSPSVKGYTPDKTVVSNKNIAHDSDDITEVVTYNADKQKASVTYIDDKTGKALKVDELNGVTKAKSGYTTKSAIDTYTSLGYTLVSDDTNGAEVVFDNDDKVGQAFTVHLGHGTITVTPEKPGKPGEPINPGEGSVDWPDDTDVKGLTDTVNRTITYVMSDGSTAPDAVDDSLSYTASKVIDKVTGEVMETKWSANQDFKDVDSPSVKGYTPDKTVVSNKNIAHDSDDITEVVTYNADKQKASVTYIDDKTGKALKVDELNGVTKAKSGYTTKSAIDTYTSLGYTLVSDDTNGAEVVFDNDDKVGQAFTVHLGHGTITVTPEKPGKPGEPINPGEGSVDWPDDTDVKGLTDTVNRTITYVMSDGSTAPDAVDDSLSYTASKVIDKVTGEVMETKWSANQDFKDVDSPSVKGYTPDKTVVSNKNIAHDSDDITEVVTYNADKQKASVTYIDDKTGKALKVDELNGVTKAKSGYTTKSAIDTYTSLGYTLVSDDTNGAEVVFDNDDKVGQAFTVHLGHGTITVTPEKPGKPGEPINPGEGSVDWPDDTDVKGLTDTVNRTITYVMSDGSTAPDAVDDSLSYTASKVIDKVTGEVMETKWSANQDFKDVDSPSVKGYTPDKTVVSNKNIAHDSDDITEVVTYNADKQKASVTYIDDKTGKALKVDELNGVTKAKSGYTTKSAIDTYTSLGYTLVSDDTNGAEVVFDNDDKVGQAFTVHLGHGTITVTPEKPGKPGEPINPGEGSVDWPDDTDVKGLTDTVNRTITYVMSDGSTAPDAVDDSLSYTASKVIDKVTGEVMETKWSANQDFKDVDSPSVKGYTPDKTVVSNKNIAHDSDDITEVVTYNADKQKASVTYIDDKTGKALKVDELNGVTKAKSGYTTKSAIDTYTSLGYTLVSDDTNGAEVVFDNDDKVGQAFTVHLGHGTITVTPEKPGKPGEPINPGEGSVDWPDDTDVKGLTDTVNRTITYVMSDGSTAPDAVDDSLSYTASKVIDKVTGEVMETKWSANQDFKDVDSPSVKGYTPDKTVVSNKNIAHDSDDITEVVTYNADKQKASVTYIDDKTGKALKVDELNGVTKAKSGYTTKSAIDTYTSLGYTLVSDDTNGAEVVFDNDDKVGQAFTVHLGHGTITVTPEKPGKPGEPINPGEGSVDWPDDTDVKGLTDTVNRTITYVMSDGSTAPDAVDDSLSYTASKVIDKVTGEVMETKWSANQDFKDVDSPSVKGYTPDKTVVSNKNIAHDSDDITEVVTYNADKQKASVTYIDDKTGKALKVDELNGVTKAKSGYTTKSAIDTYTSLGYTLVSDDTNGAEVVFDNDDKVGQAFTVHLGHGTITVTPEKPGKPGEPINPGEGSVDWPDDTDVKGLTDTVNRTITYVMSDGSTAPDAVDDSLSYTASKVIDKVTGEVMETKWSANQDFKDVDSPSVKGYTPDKTVVSNKNIAHDSDDITEVVTYNADKQKASVTYIDDKTGKALKVDELNGVTKAKSGYTTKSAIDTYTSLGYTLVSDDTNGAEVVFDNDDKVGQAFTVHLGHGTITVTPEKPGKPGEPINPGEGSVDWPDDTDVKGLTDTVNRTITYVMSDGSTAPDAVDDSLSYTASKVIDKVTGEVMETKWSANQDFKDVDSPSVKGYTPDKTVVSNKNIAHDSDDITEVVTYNADKQKASVTYIDDKTGKALKVDELNGVTKAKSGYTTKSAIDTYTSLGYTLVSDDTNGAEVVFDNDDKVGQAFTVHLGHGTITVTPEKPGKPGEPINPGEGSVDWPDDTDVKGLTDTVNRTITYVMSDGSTAPDAVDDSLSYTASKVIDKVTGEVMETKWSANQDFKDVDSPSVKGYTPDKTVVSNKNIAHDSDDITEVVTYNADKQKASVTYIDDKTGKALKVDELNGVTKAKSGYTTKSAIDTYTSLGYTLVSDDTNGAEVVFDNDDKVGQAFTVHLGHGTITVTPEKPGKPGEPINPGEGSVDWPDDTDVKGLTDTVNRTITYVMSDGSTAPDAVDDSLSYTASKVIDKVTGEVMETKWSANQDFKDVDSPSVKGYTPDKTVVSNKNIAHDSDDITEVVTYNADKQKASVTYIDDKTGKALKVDELNGVTKAKSGYTTKSAIDTYTSLGYTLVSDDTNGAEVVFDNDDKVGQAFTVHLGHGTITVTPEKPGKPGEPINPGEGSVDWPDDTDVKGLTDTVNRTITYVMSDGSTAPDAVDDSLSYTASKVIDKVTGEVMETKWSANQDFKDVDSPSVKGYTPDKTVVSNKNIAHDSDDITEVVTYNADKQKASVTYIDDKTGKALKVDELNGVTKAKSGYTTKSAIDTYTSLGYTLVSDDTNGAEVVFDNDDKVGQAFTVHLGHGTITVTPEKPGKPGEPINPGEGSVDWPDDTDVKGLTDTVNRTITYVMSDGSTAPDAVDDSLSYTASKVIDKVTGEVMETKWSANQDFKDVDSPSVKGYTPDKTVVSNKNIAHDSDDITEVVTYNADKQKASVTYIDDKTGKALKVDELNGVTKAKSGYTTKSAIDTYTSLGYTLVSDDTNGAEVVFDNDDKVGQAFTVHLGHGTITVTPEKPGKPGEPINPGEGSVDWPDDTDVKGLTDTVNRTITYVMSDGSTAPDAVDDSLSYTASKVIDKVTGEVMETKWSANQDFKDVDSPSVKGYTPDKTVVSNKNIAHDSDDITEVVTYNADKQKASVTYIDDKTGKALKVDELNGVTKAKSGYTTKSAIDTYTSLGYTLVSDDTNGAEVVFDNDDKVGQAFTVHLGHGTITVTPEKPGKPGEPINPGEGSVDWPDDTDVKGLTDTVNRTITYVMSDGSTAPDAVDDSLSYTASKVIDKVTGEVMETKWSANQDFKDVDSPSVKGYTPDKTVVSNKNIAHDSDDITEVVTYNADKQKASVTYIDDKTGKALKVDELNGVTKAKSGYTTKSAIDTYTSLGYTLVSDDTNGAEVVFDNDDKVGQAFTVHLGHGTITVTPEKPGKPGEPINPGEGSVDWPDDTDVKGLTDTVNRTITYVMSDGSTAPDAVDDSLSYTASKVIDKVTGEVMETKWSANQDFKDVDSPSVKGYTPDKTVVSNKNIAHDSDDITEVVTYNADKQKASVTYIDDKTGKALKVDELNGVTKAKSGYTTKSAIDTYTSLGYTLVSDDTNGAEVVFDNDDKVGQAFTVHLGHGTITVTPEKPGKPGEPVDPKNSEGPKYPNGTELDQVKRTGIQTIHYVGAGDKTPADNKQIFIFTREITFDNVTGKIISKTPWNVQSYTFGTVKTPVIPGYHADKAVAGDETVTPDDLNKVITVTYSPDGNPSDHGDTPSPEPTPEPEQTPDPTLDDQPDSEISSDDDFEKAEAKDKLGKTNPKEETAYKKERKIIKTKLAKQGHTEIAEPIEAKVTKENNVKVVSDPVENTAAEPKLPQTGEADNSIIGLLGMLLASFAAMFGFDSLHSYDKKHKN